MGLLGFWIVHVSYSVPDLSMWHLTLSPEGGDRFSFLNVARPETLYSWPILPMICVIYVKCHFIPSNDLTFPSTQSACHLCWISAPYILDKQFSSASEPPKLLDTHISKVICILHILEHNYLLGHWIGEYLNYYIVYSPRTAAAAAYGKKITEWWRKYIS